MTGDVSKPPVLTDALKFVGFWIEHNCKKTKKGYLVKHETVERLNAGRIPTLLG